MTVHSLLSKDEEVDNKYKVLLFIKKSGASETYRVKSNAGGVYFMKTYNFSSLHPTDLTPDKEVLEIDIIKRLSSKQTVEYKDSGIFTKSGRKYAYLIQKFISGETIQERQARQPISTIFELRRAIIDILNGLNYIHNLAPVVIHNDLTPNNVMFDLSGDDQTATIIDFGFSRELDIFAKPDLKPGVDPWYTAPETFHGAYSPQSDIFSVGALMYYLLFGMPPWFVNTVDAIEDDAEKSNSVIQLRLKPLPIPNIDTDFVGYDSAVLSIIKKALSSNIENRFQSAEEFIAALQDPNYKANDSNSNDQLAVVSKSFQGVRNTAPVTGGGFSAIAGMQALKDQLRHDVIMPLENPDEYLQHGLSLPNGMLLYGPPGCGKTFFAEKFAEEAGYNFIKVIASDLASIYIHGSQEKIAALFNSAREAAPAILYFDELDAMIPNRENLHNQSQSGEVNEFLSQLDNIGKSNVFVVGSTNKPNLIDRAAIRSGRLEKWFYIPPPDYEARKSLFELYLKSRPSDFDIDFDVLAAETENYVSSDIKFIIDEASRKTIRYKLGRISMNTLIEIINNHKPTVPLSEIQKYDSIRMKMEGESESNSSGFKNPFGFAP